MSTQLNETWEAYIKNTGADFVRFVDISSLPEHAKGDYACAVFFGKALTRAYVKALKAGESPARHEFGETEHAMDALADALADKLTAEGYKSVSNLEFARLPHKTVARMAGFGFIGKNALLINDAYGCAMVLGKVLTAAPFSPMQQAHPKESRCGDCSICVDICPKNALSGHPWTPATGVAELLNEDLCTTCLLCMVHCPHTERYMNRNAL